MFTSFDDRAMSAVATARDEARRCHDTHIGTSHLMLGLLRMLKSGSTTWSLLPSEEEFRKLVRAEARRRRAPHPFCDIWFTERVIRVLQEATRSASGLVTPSCLLGAILADPDAQATLALEGLGVDVGMLVDELEDDDFALFRSKERTREADSHPPACSPGSEAKIQLRASARLKPMLPTRQMDISITEPYRGVAER